MDLWLVDCEGLPQRPVISFNAKPTRQTLLTGPCTTPLSIRSSPWPLCIDLYQRAAKSVSQTSLTALDENGCCKVVFESIAGRPASATFRVEPKEHAERTDRDELDASVDKYCQSHSINDFMRENFDLLLAERPDDPYEFLARRFREAAAQESGGTMPVILQSSQENAPRQREAQQLGLDMSLPPILEGVETPTPKNGCRDELESPTVPTSFKSPPIPRDRDLTESSDDMTMAKAARVQDASSNAMRNAEKLSPKQRAKELLTKAGGPGVLNALRAAQSVSPKQRAKKLLSEAGEVGVLNALQKVDHHDDKLKPSCEEEVEQQKACNPMSVPQEPVRPQNFSTEDAIEPSGGMMAKSAPSQEATPRLRARKLLCEASSTKLNSILSKAQSLTPKQRAKQLLSHAGEGGVMSALSKVQSRDGKSALLVQETSSNDKAAPPSLMQGHKGGMPNEEVPMQNKSCNPAMIGLAVGKEADESAMTREALDKAAAEAMERIRAAEQHLIAEKAAAERFVTELQGSTGGDADEAALEALMRIAQAEKLLAAERAAAERLVTGEAAVQAVAESEQRAAQAEAQAQATAQSQAQAIAEEARAALRRGMAEQPAGNDAKQQEAEEAIAEEARAALRRGMAEQDARQREAEEREAEMRRRAEEARLAMKLASERAAAEEAMRRMEVPPAEKTLRWAGDRNEVRDGSSEAVDRDLAEKVDILEADLRALIHEKAEADMRIAEERFTAALQGSELSRITRVEQGLSSIPEASNGVILPQEQAEASMLAAEEKFAPIFWENSRSDQAFSHPFGASPYSTSRSSQHNCSFYTENPSLQAANREMAAHVERLEADVRALIQEKAEAPLIDEAMRLAAEQATAEEARRREAAEKEAAAKRLAADEVRRREAEEREGAMRRAAEEARRREAEERERTMMINSRAEAADREMAAHVERLEAEIRALIQEKAVADNGYQPFAPVQAVSPHSPMMSHYWPNTSWNDDISGSVDDDSQQLSQFVPYLAGDAIRKDEESSWPRPYSAKDTTPRLTKCIPTHIGSPEFSGDSDLAHLVPNFECSPNSTSSFGTGLAHFIPDDPSSYLSRHDDTINSSYIMPLGPSVASTADSLGQFTLGQQQLWRKELGFAGNQTPSLSNFTPL